MTSTSTTSTLALLLACLISTPTMSAAEGGALLPYVDPDSGRMGFTDASQRPAISPRFDVVGYFSEGLAGFSRAGAWGYIDAHGDIAVKPTYDAVFAMREGRGRVVKNGHAGFVDAHGAEIVPPTYDEAWDFHDGVAMVESAGDRLFIDAQGKVLLDSHRSQALDYSDGMICLRDEDGWKYVDIHGATVIAGPFQDADAFSEGFAAVRMQAKGKDQKKQQEKAKWGYIAKDGTIAIAPAYDAADAFHEGLAAVIVDHASGFIDVHGKVAIPLSFAGVERFHDGRSMVAIGKDRIAYIDKAGTVIPAGDLVNGEHFRDGAAHVVATDREGYIAADGTWIVTFARRTVAAASPAATFAGLDIEALKKKAAAGDGDAAYALGSRILADTFSKATLDDATVVANLRLAHEWIGKAAAAGCAQAQADLGNTYLTGYEYPGFAIAPDPAKAIDLLTKASEQGNSDGMVGMGNAYADGAGVPKDPQRSLAWYRRAAEARNPQAYIALATLYAEGTGVRADKAQAETWYRKALGTACDDMAKEGLHKLAK